MCKRFAIVLMTALGLLSTGAVADDNTTEIRGQTVPTTLTVGDTELVLNGGERRRRWMINAYVGALYLEEKTDDAQAIIDADAPMAKKMIITSNLVSRNRMISAIDDGFEKSTGGYDQFVEEHGEEYARYRQEMLDSFEGELESGDVVIISYEPGKGLRIEHNGEEIGLVEESIEFKKAVFGIWLGDDPVQESLKEGLLGQR